MSRVSQYIEVGLEEFEDIDVLREARRILERLEDGHEPIELQREIALIRRLLSVDILPPPSTAWTP